MCTKAGPVRRPTRAGSPGPRGPVPPGLLRPVRRPARARGRHRGTVGGTHAGARRRAADRAARAPHPPPRHNCRHDSRVPNGAHHRPGAGAAQALGHDRGRGPWHQGGRGPRPRPVRGQPPGPVGRAAAALPHQPPPGRRPASHRRTGRLRTGLGDRPVGGLVPRRGLPAGPVRERGAQRAPSPNAPCPSWASTRRGRPRWPAWCG